MSERQRRRRERPDDIDPRRVCRRYGVAREFTRWITSPVPTDGQVSPIVPTPLKELHA